MPQETLFPLTLRLTAGRLTSSPVTLAFAAGLPVLLAWAGLKDSYETAARLFAFLFPYAFLFAARETAWTDIERGRLENVLFLRGRHRLFLWQKNFAAALIAGGYAVGIFLLMAAWGSAVGRLDEGSILGFGRGLLAGFYYVALAGLVGVRSKSAGNVTAVLLAQAASAAALLFSATARVGFIDHLAAGRFPDLPSKLLLAGLLAVCPQLSVFRTLARFSVLVGVGTLVFLAVEFMLLRRRELRI